MKLREFAEPPVREVERTPEFEKQQAKIEGDNPQEYDDGFQAIEWAFARAEHPGDWIGHFLLTPDGPRVRVVGIIGENPDRAELRSIAIVEED